MANEMIRPGSGDLMAIKDQEKEGGATEIEVFLRQGKIRDALRIKERYNVPDDVFYSEENKAIVLEKLEKNLDWGYYGPYYNYLWETSAGALPFSDLKPFGITEEREREFATKAIRRLLRCGKIKDALIKKDQHNVPDEDFYSEENKAIVINGLNEQANTGYGVFHRYLWKNADTLPFSDIEPFGINEKEFQRLSDEYIVRRKAIDKENRPHGWSEGAPM